MMILLFSVGNDNYGINIRDVTEVLPNVTLKQFPHAPEYVAGLLNYRGEAVPVIDLTWLMSAHASRNRISSRIVLVSYVNEESAHHLFGMLVEKITETVKIPDHVFTRSSVMTDAAPFLGDIAIHDGALIQVIDIKKVLSDSMKVMLFRDYKESGAIASSVEC